MSLFANVSTSTKKTMLTIAAVLLTIALVNTVVVLVAFDRSAQNIFVALFVTAMLYGVLMLLSKLKQDTVA
jgi:hypothetical protein